ncbi:MAG: ABC transporter ATP-binding protein [Pararhodobacter sp.]|nr:ABC transporter ATP-binding protein [Pararhodobacter sp.]
MLETRDISVSYGKHRALHGVSLKVAPGEIVVILGANGAGKSTLLKAIAGICEGQVRGQIAMQGEPLLGLPPHKVVERGVALVPEGRGIFGDLSVRDNLMLGANPDRAREDAGANFDRLTRLFPKLAERAGQVARTMSGGEQQMVAIGRAMMSNPVILMLDEPSLGLSPLLSKELFQNLKAVREAGLGILLVEQNARLSLGIADRGYLLENGEILREDRAEVLRNDPAVQAAYLGGAAAAAPAAAVARPAASPAARAAPALAADTPAPTALPARVRPRAQPSASRPAAQVAGLDIDALVARAATRATPPPAATAFTARPAMPTPRSDALGDMLRGIEKAAQQARQRRSPGTGAALAPLRPSIRDRRRGDAPAHTAPPPAPPSAPPPAPHNPRPGGKVEIWRRRPGSTQFDRMEN